MNIRLEEMLVDEGLLSEEQFNQVQNTPRPNGLKVQEYILREGLVADTDMVSVLSNRLNIPKYDPDHYPVDPELAAILPASMAGKHRMVPLRQEENLLIVAMSDPTEVVDMDAVQRHVKMEVEPVICTETEYIECWAHRYIRHHCIR